MPCGLMSPPPKILSFRSQGSPQLQRGKGEDTLYGTQVGMPSQSALWEGNKRIRESGGMSTPSVLLRPPATFLS